MQTVSKEIAQGGVKERLCVDKPVTDKNTIMLPENPHIAFVCFRCKDKGWKKYNVEIRISL